MGKANHYGAVRNKRSTLLECTSKRAFSLQEKCDVENKNVNDLAKQSGLCITAVTQYCALAHERVKNKCKYA